MQVDRRTFIRRGMVVGAGGLVRPPCELRVPSTNTFRPRTLREQVGQLFVVSLTGLIPDSSFLSLMRRNHFGGVILFARNCQSARQVQAMVHVLQAESRYPLLVGMDQEGG